MPARARLLDRALPLALALGILFLLRWSGAGVAAMGPESTTVALGFLLIAAFVAGNLVASVGLPRLSGYLAVGLVVGPYATGLLSRDMLMGGKAIEGIAVSLIALTAGGEIRIDWLKKQIRSLATMSVLQIAFIGTSVAAVVYFGRSFFPFVPDDEPLRAAVIALSLAAIAVSNSPTVTIAVIAENRAAGPLSRAVLGITVFVDVCVIVLFASMLAFARDVLGEGGGPPLALSLLREIGGSIVAGVLVGLGIPFFLRFVRRDAAVFVLAVSYAISEVAEMLHLECLLIALTAGFWVENFSAGHGDKLIKAIERASLPVFALFFAFAGAKVNLAALASMGVLALVLSLVRLMALWLGMRVGTALSPVEPVVRRYAWLGLISQAGVTLALASILARAFPAWGEDIQVVIIAMIAVHEVIGPIAFQFALRRAGEVGAA